MRMSRKHYEREKILRRLSFLTGGISTIYPGGHSEVEIIEKRKRLEDAVYTVRTALAEGVLPGGGSALLHISGELEGVVNQLEGDEKAGAKLLQAALKKPVSLLAENGGQNPGWVVDTLMKEKDFAMGFDGDSGKLVNMWDAKIMDSAKVLSCAVANAASVASTVLTAEAVVADCGQDAHRPPKELI